MGTEPVTGWAVRTSHGIDIRTVGPTRRSAIINWLVAGEFNPNKYQIGRACPDEQIEAAWLQEHGKSGADAIRIVVQAVN